MKNMNIKAMQAFSLAEVLITLIIVSVLMIIIAPMITKSMVKTKGDGVVFVYSPENNTLKDDVCFLTESEYDSTGVGNQKYISSKSCSEYTFTVPENVNNINLTLVAGGGGGGGASGGIVSETNIDLADGAGSTNVSQTFFGHLIKSVRINALTGRGTNGSGEESIKGSTAGVGGKSSSALIGLLIPSKLMRGVNYTPTNINTHDITAQIKIEADNANISIKNSADNSEVIYKVPFQTTADNTTILQPVCLIGNASANLVYDCGANTNNYFAGSLGTGSDEAAKVPTSGTVHLNSVVWGGDGGKIPQIPNGYGWGGKNSDYILSKCDNTSNSQSCTASSTLEYTKMTAAKNAGAAYGSLTVTTETPGVAGGGGAGGSAIRIKNFAVTPGQTYIIRVGKGGTGGRAGITDKNGLASTGGDGESGTSTAIYSLEGGIETLVYMVNGGAGGLKGSLNTAGNNNTQTAYSGRNKNAVFTSKTNFTDIITDDEIIGGKIDSSTTTAAEMPANTGAGAVGYIKYSFYKTVPFDYLSYLKDYDTKTLYTDNAYGGHSAFNINNVSCTPASDQTVLCGVSQRLTTNGTYLYTGGLGGFSGLKTKAGCGGYYAGNNIVKISTGEIVETNKLYTPDNIGAGVLNGSEKINTDDIYDNCTTKTPDGQTADFIAPDALNLKFGSAGSGGGGGGYSINDGAGRGGNGQDGYLMIDWRK